MASELRVDKIVPVDGIGTDTSTVKYGGGIIQVKQLQLTNADVGGFFLSTTSSSFTQTNSAFSLSITPKFNTSKIYISLITFKYLASADYAYTTIYRDSTNIGGSTYGMADFTGSHNWRMFSMMFLDSPTTTSSVTYRVYGRTTNNTLYFGGDGDMVNAITLMEVSA